jgi:hypothetical protein
MSMTFHEGYTITLDQYNELDETELEMMVKLEYPGISLIARPPTDEDEPTKQVPHFDINGRPLATECKRGHTFTEETTRLTRRGDGFKRTCKICERETPSAKAQQARRRPKKDQSAIAV